MQVVNVNIKIGTAVTGKTTVGTITMDTTIMATGIMEASILKKGIGMDKVTTDTGVNTGTNRVKMVTKNIEE